MSLYPFARFITGLMLKLGGMRIWGWENVSEDSAVIVIANHVSFGDPPALSQAFPYHLTYIAKEGFRDNRFTGMIFGACGAVFLRAGESDLTALRYAIKELKQGNAVAIFPEGTRHYDQQMGEFKPGAAYIAHHTGAKVIPVSLINTGDYWRFWRHNIIVNVGQPITLEKVERLDKEYLERYNQIFAARVKKLFDESKEVLQKEGRKMRKPSKRHR
jgi:1-acyl-sn-glycerol-3-phosphate acyltransferase